MATPALPSNDLQTVRRDVASRKVRDQLFVVVGLVALFACLLSLLVLFSKLVMDGSDRFTWEFVSSFPSRRAAQAGILAAWVGSSLVMLVTACTAVPVGVMAAIYLEEYAPKNWFSGNYSLAEQTAFRNGTLQGAYLIMAARALGSGRKPKPKPATW